ncbi:DoxX-like family protein [Bacillus sp. H-16]|uniref:DoxX-like family protein n=1 Tax=Alteribacter salitolerans TaxID=2912333 RepID=UPI001962EBCD|nr:DoxX-like family protein [Alteribacter salitolerans]MBM7097863.1 DoxX-like family protein [Alteribacter salitolerans]
MKRKPIYVETNIRTDMESLWKYTQKPHLHERWDLRFSKIEYLEKEHEDAPQHFTYETRIGFGLGIKGTGVSRGERFADSGERTSSLGFFSGQRLSLIKEGSGYWKYRNLGDGDITFLTQYDYKTRWGAVGQVIDRFTFRPLIGWATSWSFDTLRLLLEKGITPEDSLKRSFIHMFVCFALSFVWLYQGLVPKLLFPHTGEVAMVVESGLFSGMEEGVVRLIGFVQCVLGMLFLLPIEKKWLFAGSSAAVFFLGLGPLFVQPEVFLLPFNPASLNVPVIVLGVIGAVNCKHLPLARRCRRKRK